MELQIKRPVLQRIASAIAMMMMLLPSLLSGQDIYPRIFEDLSELPPSLGPIVRQASAYNGVQEKQDDDKDGESKKDDKSSKDKDDETNAAEKEKPNEGRSPSSRRSGRAVSRTRPPKVINDFLITHQFEFTNGVSGTFGDMEYVVPGRLRIADNNSAQTDNRIIFRQNHFQNAIDSSLYDGIGTQYERSSSVDEYWVGFEKTIGACERWSIELRLPLLGTPDEVFAAGFSGKDAATGNLALIAKRVLSQTDRRVISAGLGLSLPTGDDANFIVDDESFTVKNRATHLAPFIAGLWTPNEKWFYHGFLTFDVPASSNPIEYRELTPFGSSAQLGSLTNQTLLNLSAAAGRWWFCGRQDRAVTAFSSMIELHYTSSFGDGDMVTAYTPDNYVQFRNPLGAFDSLNATVGFDVEIFNRIHLRTAAVAPLQNSDDRFFDAEFQTSINFSR